MSKAFAYVAHKNGGLAGVCAPDVPDDIFNDFCHESLRDGLTIQPVYSREEYLKFLAGKDAAAIRARAGDA